MTVIRRKTQLADVSFFKILPILHIKEKHLTTNFHSLGFDEVT